MALSLGALAAFGMTTTKDPPMNGWQFQHKDLGSPGESIQSHINATTVRLEQCSNITENGCWPQFFILGDQKTGTAMVFDALKDQKLVCGASTTVCGGEPSMSSTAVLADTKSGEYLSKLQSKKKKEEKKDTEKKEEKDDEEDETDIDLEDKAYNRDLPNGTSVQKSWPSYFSNVPMSLSGRAAHALDLDDDDWGDLKENPNKYTMCYPAKTGNCPSLTYVDATPEYLSDPRASRRMLELVPGNWMVVTRFVVLIREPIARAVSQYNAAMRSAFGGGEEALVKKGKKRSSGVSELCTENAKSDDEWFSDEPPTFAEEMKCDMKQVQACFDDADSTDKYSAVSNAFDVKDDKGTPIGDYWGCFDGKEVKSPMMMSMVSRGMYAAQLRSWHAPLLPLSRSQLLVIDAQTVLDAPFDALNRISTFYGVGNYADQGNVAFDEDPYMDEIGGDLTREGAVKRNIKRFNNDDHDPYVEKITCETMNALKELYAPWNKLLFYDLQKAASSGAAPPQEPAFEGFGQSAIECSSEETYAFKLNGTSIGKFSSYRSAQRDFQFASLREVPAKGKKSKEPAALLA